MPTPQKEAIVAELRQSIEDSEGIYLADFRHLDVSEMNELRGQILEHQAYLRIAKNRLLKLAFAGTDAEDLTKYLTGPTAVAFCESDPIVVAKILTDFGQNHEHLAIKAGLFDGMIFDQEQMGRIAKLPPRDQLLALLLSTLISPASSLVNLLGAVTSQFVFTLEAIADKRKQEEEVEEQEEEVEEQEEEEEEQEEEVEEQEDEEEEQEEEEEE